MKRKTAPPEPLGPPLLDIDDVAKHTKVSSRTVRRWIKDEGLPIHLGTAHASPRTTWRTFSSSAADRPILSSYVTECPPKSQPSCKRRSSNDLVTRSRQSRLSTPGQRCLEETNHVLA